MTDYEKIVKLQISTVEDVQRLAIQRVSDILGKTVDATNELVNEQVCDYILKHGAKMRELAIAKL